MVAIVDYIDEQSSGTGRYDLSDDQYRFMFADGVEPTDNHTEQQVRFCVADRRITQGTRGEAGQRYHERMWSAIANAFSRQRGLPGCVCSFCDRYRYRDRDRHRYRATFRWNEMNVLSRLRKPSLAVL